MTDSHWHQLRHKHQMVWDALRELGIACVLVEFSGSGDEGQIDDCYPEGSDGHGVFANKTLTVDAGQSSILLRDLMIELSDEILQND